MLTLTGATKSVMQLVQGKREMYLLGIERQWFALHGLLRWFTGPMEKCNKTQNIGSQKLVKKIFHAKFGINRLFPITKQYEGKVY